MPFVAGEEKLNEEIEKENYANPELKSQEAFFKIESFVVECVDRNPDNEEN